MCNGFGRIAVCGKGGVGKTAFIAMLSKVLLEDGKAGDLLIIDADPAVGLPSALGITVKNTIGQVREQVLDAAESNDPDAGKNMASKLDYLIMESLVEADGFSYIAMGRTEKRGCYCSVNDLLRLALDSMTDKFDTILIDGEAGLEQINRQVTKSLDYLYILTDASNRGRETIEHIRHIVVDEKTVECGDVEVILNRVPDGKEDALTDLIGKQDLPIGGIIPLDETVIEYDLVGRSLHELPDDSPALAAVRRIGKRLAKKTE